MSAEICRQRTALCGLCALAVLSVLLLGAVGTSGATSATGVLLSGDKEGHAGAPAAEMPALSPDCWWPTANPFTNTILYDVDMLSSSDAWAVGARNGTSLVGRWNGAAWSQAYTGPGPSELHAVSALSSTYAWAVGASGTLTVTPSALYWDGSSWSTVAVPAPTSTGRLYDIALLDAGNAWAVGYYASGYTSYPLIEHWDGAAWTVWPAPGTGSLQGIFALGPNDIWAVGGQNLPSPLVMHWDGAAWSIVSGPPQGQSSVLLSVSGTSPTDIWAVGSTTLVNGVTSPLILHWSGAGWRAVTSPDLPSSVPLPDYGWLSSVVALSPTDAWAVGGRLVSVFRWPIILRWNGTSWTSASTQHFDTTNVEGVDAISSSEALAVGRYYGSGGGGAFMARFQEGPCPTPTPTPTPPPCGTFTDVPANNTFYPFVRCLACRDIIQGYPCGSDFEPCVPPDNLPYFRPDSLVTRSQLSKIVSNSAGFNEPVLGQSFEDVPPESPYFNYVGRLAARGYISGYPCGGPGEPCLPPVSQPYFRPNAGATRGQLTKVVSSAAGFTDTVPPAQYTFADIPPAHTFWVYVERLLLNRSGVMSGYSCGGPGEPCDAENRAYFRPNNPLTRGQTSKIVANTFFPGCNPPRP